MVTGFERHTKETRQAEFLAEMERVDAAHLLLQQRFKLSDPAVEEAPYDSAEMRQFVGIDQGRELEPDETTVCKFRHLLEDHGLGRQMLETLNLHLQDKGRRTATGTIVDAIIIIHVPRSTKSREQQRDPEMHQANEGTQWYFKMKAHVGGGQ